MGHGLYVECIKLLGDLPFRRTSLHWWNSKAILLEMVKDKMERGAREGL